MDIGKIIKITKVVIKILTVLPVVYEGIKAILVKAEKEIREEI